MPGKIFITLCLCIISYFMGCFNAAYFYSSKLKNMDIRQYGSGNAGTTNVLRVFGAKAALLVFLVDALKGFLAVRMAMYFAGGIPAAQVLCALCVVAGHNWPLFLKFRGGKGVATSIGIAFALNWATTLIALGVGVIIIAIWRMVSLGAVIGLGISPFVFWLGGSSGQSVLVMTFLAAMSLWQHRGNIRRILRGEENKLGQKK